MKAKGKTDEDLKELLKYTRLEDLELNDERPTFDTVWDWVCFFISFLLFFFFFGWFVLLLVCWFYSFVVVFWCCVGPITTL